MNVLSLFDGMSAGQCALIKAGIPITNYFASEIDKYAIKVTQHNFPNTIQLGSIVDLDTSKLPLIDLLVGGSPCQSFSFAGYRQGMSTTTNMEITTFAQYNKAKNDGYEFAGQSYLFWEYIRILQDIRPKYFLLENVEMGSHWENVISRALGIRGIHICSSAVVPQYRKRIYWTNIAIQKQGLFDYYEPTISTPVPKKIILSDILETQFDSKYYLSDRMTSKAIFTNSIKNIIGHSGSGGQKGVLHNIDGIMTTLCATDFKQPKQILTDKGIRRLTPIEYERLQGFDDNYSNVVSDAQRYKMIGNSFTVPIITHIFNHI